MASILPFDEINAMIRQEYSEAMEDSDKKKAAQRIADLLLEYLIFAYRMGVKRTATDLGGDIEDDIDEMYEIIFCLIEGETFEDRVRRWVEEEAEGRLGVLAESEAHRVCESAGYSAAERASSEKNILVGKRWETMQDDRVRETHEYLQGTVVPLNEEFYTSDGDHAQEPGGFMMPENNCGCRFVTPYVNLSSSGDTDDI
jgi:hypothetical protein